MGDHDREIFLAALENLPDDLCRAKFDGARPEARKPRAVGPKKVHDAVIDLHGFTREEALSRLRYVFHRMRGRNWRILVITGRGNHSGDGVGVLRDAVVHFLETEGGAYIRDYGQASPEYGGSGALDIRGK